MGIKLLNLFDTSHRLGSKLIAKSFLKTDAVPNQIVEFIGPPGSGKTFLKNSLKKHFDFYDLNSLETLPLYLSNQANVSGYDAIPNYYFAKNEKAGMRLMKKVNNVVTLDAIAKKMNKIAFSDEGIFHHFYDFWIDLYANDEALFKSFINNRKFVFLQLNSQKILENIRSREKQTGHIWAGHKGLTDAEILDFNQKLSEAHADLLTKIIQAGGKCIAIEDNNQTEKIISFLKQN